MVLQRKGVRLEHLLCGELTVWHDACDMFALSIVMSLQCEWRINHVFPLSITEVIVHKLSLLSSGTHGTYIVRITCIGMRVQ